MPVAHPYTAESFAPEKPQRLDREKGVAYGVRAVGPRSKNGARYPILVLRAALPFYDNAAVNIGHHYDLTKDVPPSERFGRATNPRADERGILVDVRYNPKHEFAAKFEWACENAPDFYSFSHYARVKWSPTLVEGDRVAESILAVASLDIVSDGGTTSSIFESGRSGTVDPSAIGAGLSDPATALDFLKQLWAALPLDDAQKQTLLADLAGAASPSNPDPAANPTAAAESLRRFGKLGVWAADRLGESLAAESAAQRREWAETLIAREALPQALASTVFVELVAESYGNEARAKDLIADRKSLGHGKGFAPAPARPAGSGGAKLSVAQLVADMAAG